MPDNGNPFFSIVIPTYNRGNLLRRAINSFLDQKFQNFEIIISDNNSIDNTKEIVESFNDKKIIYSKNNENIGFVLNVEKAILMASGKYIITHGDDDVILYSNGLQRIHDLIIEKEYGFMMINHLSKDRQNKEIACFWVNKSEDIYITKNMQSISVINFLEEVAIGFLSGLVFKNENIQLDDFINSEMAPWIKILFRLSKKYGAAFIHDTYIIHDWSNREIPNYIIDKKNRIFFENYYDCITEELLNKNEADLYKKFYFDQLRKQYRWLFPAIKYYTNNKNLKAYKNRLIYLNNNFKSDIKLWIYYLISTCLPKFLLSFIRKHVHFNRIESNINYKELDIIKKRYYELTE